MNSIFAISYGNQNQSLQYMLRVYIIWQKKSIEFLRIQMEKMVIESEGREGELGHIWRSWAENGARDSIRKWIIIRLPWSLFYSRCFCFACVCVWEREREREREREKYRDWYRARVLHGLRNWLRPWWQGAKTTLIWVWDMATVCCFIL